ncbi:hypothetical protein [Natronolimnohabitans innermongolicus]|uniref:Uncharacterized protein n=1 Tax=Natronolimnohabitans innermongolicus JCM 12255 TaxID=1227499 RepID=L9WLY5_9EURY|nr:hypothetical protein [Natronolimnohabitans innermongolicus]ELY49358.1 hypothetical protein C493_20846 [Natronolimnohabitans innermongolicus JCM 12255]
MSGDDRYKLFGVYLSDPVVDALADTLYEEAGVVDLESYFEANSDAVPRGDPGADATDEFVATLLESFAERYDEADFEAAESVDADGFNLVHLAATPQRVSDVRERFRAAETIQESDLRTVQTAIVAAALDIPPDGTANARSPD